MKFIIGILIMWILFFVIGAFLWDLPTKTEPDMIHGFFAGYWHGSLATFSFIKSIFVDDSTIYSIHNTGNWYNFGYILGWGSLFSFKFSE